MLFRSRGYTLQMIAQAAGWLTPSANEDPAGTEKGNMQIMLSHQALLTGSEANGTTAATASSAGFRLNPRFSLWLMGYPQEWWHSVVLAMQSFPRSQRSSSRRISKA